MNLIKNEFNQGGLILKAFEGIAFEQHFSKFSFLWNDTDWAQARTRFYTSYKSSQSLRDSKSCLLPRGD